MVKGWNDRTGNLGRHVVGIGGKAEAVVGACEDLIGVGFGIVRVDGRSTARLREVSIPATL